MVATALVSCGAPPEPLPTAPPEARRSDSLAPSGVPPAASAPTAGLPTGYPGVGLPTGGLPGYPAPTYPTPPAPPATTPWPTRSLPPPAPVCGTAPTKRQMLDLIKGKPGIPNQPLEVRFGPYCAGSWQLAIVGIVGKTADKAEELLVVTTGRAASPQLVEVGADVCTDRIERDAPPGIRVLACGS